MITEYQPRLGETHRTFNQVAPAALPIGEIGVASGDATD